MTAVGLPPIRARDFWAVQGLVFLIAGTHTFLEVAGHVELPPSLYLIPTSLFFVPVVYAAVRFGARGSITTALWSIALTLPNVLFLHSGLERIGILWQLGILLVIGAFVGVRVDRERLARAETEARERALEASQERYRALFDDAADAVFVLDPAGLVEGANAAAGRLLARDPGALPGNSVADLLGPEIARAAMGERDAGRPFAHGSGPDGQVRWLEVVASGQLVDPEGHPYTQVLLHDVTLQEERRQGLERYARRTVTAREEERRRIGRELHDGPLQSLMQVGRTLDALGDVDSLASASVVAGEARGIVDATATELRQLSRALRPSILDDLGLVPAIRSEVAAFGRRSGTFIRIAVDGTPGPAAPETELMLLRVAQEALHNVERHAAASRVDVRLVFAAGRICFVIRDDGRGPGPLPSAAALLGSGKLGLVGMEERTRLAGGDFTIRARRTGGTTVAVTVPLVGAAQA